MKTNKLLLCILLIFISLVAFTQEGADSALTFARDVVVKTNGNLFQCRIVQVNDSLVVYQLPEKDTTGQLYNVPRSDVYAIAYGNGIAQVITSELMGQHADIYAYDNSCEAWKTFKQGLGKGSISLGVGFVDVYSPIKDSKSFEDNKVMPSVFAGYTFRIKGSLKGGVHIGVGGNELSKYMESDYDQLKVSTEIDQQFLCVGLYCRYDILDGMIRPYAKAGVDFFGVWSATTSEATSLNGSNYSVKTVADQSGIKPGLILRAGLDLYLGSKFGIYGDVGTGLSLVQIGVLFNLE